MNNNDYREVIEDEDTDKNTSTEVENTETSEDGN